VMAGVPLGICSIGSSAGIRGMLPKSASHWPFLDLYPSMRVLMRLVLRVSVPHHCCRARALLPLPGIPSADRGCLWAAGGECSERCSIFLVRQNALPSWHATKADAVVDDPLQLINGMPRAKRSHGITPAGRQRLSEMMKQRWAERRKHGTRSAAKKTGKGHLRRRRDRLTPAGRRKLSLMMKRRWAERRKQTKAA
jgi:hypothetical protein